MTNIRVRYPDRVRFDGSAWTSCPSACRRRQSAAADAASPAGRFVPLGQLATIEASAAPTSCGARTSSR